MDLLNYILVSIKDILFLNMMIIIIFGIPSYYILVLYTILKECLSTRKQFFVSLIPFGLLVYLAKETYNDLRD